MSSAEDPLQWLEGSAGEHASRPTFDQQLSDIDARLVAVAKIVRDLIPTVTEAFLEADAASAERSISADAEVDLRCAQLEEECFAILARQAPVAGDLRRVVSVLRCTSDVQRSGDLLRHVAESLAWVHPPSMKVELRQMIDRLGRVSGMVFAGAVDAWSRRDALAAVDLQHLDDEVDLLQKSLLTELYLGGQTVEEAVSLALICRYYERIADHGVEMARQVTYAMTGDRPPPD